MSKSTPERTDETPLTWDPDAPAKIVISCTADEKQQILEIMRRQGKRNISAYMIAQALGPYIQEIIKRAVEDALRPHREHKQKELELVLYELQTLRAEVAQLKKK